MQNVSWAQAFDRCTQNINYGQLFNTTPRAFAGVYYPSNGDCQVYLHNPTVIYPVRIQMENYTNAMSFVKAKGHEGFNYGLSSQPSSPQYNENVSDDHNMNISKTTTHLDEPSDTYINTGNIISDYTQTFAQDADISTISITTNRVYATSNYAHTLLTTEPVSTGNTGTADETLDCVCVCNNSTASPGKTISLSDLRIDKTTLSSYRRRYSSVRDHRFSATIVNILNLQKKTLMAGFFTRMLAVCLSAIVMTSLQKFHYFFTFGEEFDNQKQEYQVNSCRDQIQANGIPLIMRGIAIIMYPGIIDNDYYNSIQQFYDKMIIDTSAFKVIISHLRRSFDDIHVDCLIKAGETKFDEMRILKMTIEHLLC
ncbi:unnamed protein product [Mytilus edulis]|uniref:Uncharacterized protein n=1 Tax=Mytilus edulis TaxID=6550 RepID=A0A8S3T0B2_MYTED|nr:unnamed protein product [Mytilus edulis]